MFKDFVFEDGRVVNSGTYDELMTLRKIQKLVTNQRILHNNLVSASLQIRSQAYKLGLVPLKYI